MRRNVGGRGRAARGRRRVSGALRLPGPGLGGGGRGRGPSWARIWARRAWASVFAAACSTSSMRPSTDGLGELGHALGLGVARLDLVADLVEGRHVLADRLGRARPSPCSSAPASWPGRAGTGASGARPACAGARWRSVRPPPWPGRRPGRTAGASVLRSSTSFSTAMSRLAKDSAAAVYSVDLGGVALLLAPRRPSARPGGRWR